MKKLAKFIKAQEKNMYDEVTDFFFANPNPADDLFHQWCEKMNFDVHQAEADAYKLATLAAKFLKGGRSVEKGVTRNDVDQKELAMGIKVELEHIDDTDVAAKIAVDHLAEADNYYTKLLKMEKELGV